MEMRWAFVNRIIHLLTEGCLCCQKYRFLRHGLQEGSRDAHSPDPPWWGRAVGEEQKTALELAASIRDMSRGMVLRMYKLHTGGETEREGGGPPFA
jgi:hypothetical protein